jgi:hypothetical protein
VRGEREGEKNSRSALLRVMIANISSPLWWGWWGASNVTLKCSIWCNLSIARATQRSRTTPTCLCVQSTHQPPPDLNNNLWILKYPNILNFIWELQQNHIKKTKTPSLAVLIFSKLNSYVLILLFKKIKKNWEAPLPMLFIFSF